MTTTNQLSWLIPVMDGVELNRKHPDTFTIPSETDKNRIKTGDFVKAGFSTGATIPTERMWVRVVEIDAGLIRGTLANTPAYVEAKHGDLVEMEFRHVLAIQEGL
jgi:hypothetical protein